MLTAMNLTLFGRIVLQNQEFFWKFIQQMAHHYHQEVSSVHLVKDITNVISIKASRNFTPLFLYTKQLHINCPFSFRYTSINLIGLFMICLFWFVSGRQFLWACVGYLVWQYGFHHTTREKKVICFGPSLPIVCEHKVPYPLIYIISINPGYSVSLCRVIYMYYIVYDLSRIKVPCPFLNCHLISNLERHSLAGIFGLNT